MSRPRAEGAPGASVADRLVRMAHRAAGAMSEFFAVPLLIVLAFVVLAVVSILADQNTLHVEPVRAALGHVIGKKAAAPTLQAIASGVVTVTSITFSMLLLAVQQTASTLSPVVFDQFIRRKGNQVLLGFFVGLALYAYLVMAAVQNKTPPIIGAFLATVLTVVAMLFLLLLIYMTVNQMRPANVVRQIHDRALQARRRERELIRRTRREEQSSHPVLATFTADTNGYVTKIELPALARALERVPGAEIRLHVALGDYVAFGDTVATVRDDDEDDARSVERAVRSALVIGRQRDLQQDATTGVDELGNIAWSSGSTAKHNPEVARQALHELRDLVARWLRDGLDDENVPAPKREQPMAVVYPDNDIERAFDTLYSLLLAAHESHQHMTAARVLDAYAALLPAAPPEVRERINRDLKLAAPILGELPPSQMLKNAQERLKRGLPV